MEYLYFENGSESETETPLSIRACLISCFVCGTQDIDGWHQVPHLIFHHIFFLIHAGQLCISQTYDIHHTEK